MVYIIMVILEKIIQMTMEIILEISTVITMAIT
jgi:hypothetical protein